MVSSPAVASGWMPASGLSGTTSVSGPGQNFSASLFDSGSKRPMRSAIASEATWAMSGLKRGRPFASYILATAAPLVASPASP